jgi:hypothetical protein
MRWWLCLCGSLLLVARVSAQEPLAAADTSEERGAPSVNVRGFADLNWARTSDRAGDSGGATRDGFSLGYIVGHVSGSLGGKFSFYSEVTLTQTPDENAGFVTDVARAFLRYDFNDHFKISLGRYHAPVTYWATAFHRGQWLQTTVFRPDYIKDEWFQPDHFNGVVAEGMLVSRAGIGYIAGFGNGRELDLRKQSDPNSFADELGDTNNIGHHHAEVGRLFARPPQVTGVEFGGALYHDVISQSGTPGVPEWISSAYLAITRETPEIIAEFSNLRHTYLGARFDSQAFYVQLAYRLKPWPRVKPYGRFERAISADGEPIIGDLSNRKSAGGARFELTDTAALKVEYSYRSPSHRKGLYVQTAFTF